MRFFYKKSKKNLKIKHFYSNLSVSDPGEHVLEFRFDSLLVLFQNFDSFFGQEGAWRSKSILGPEKESQGPATGKVSCVFGSRREA